MIFCEKPKLRLKNWLPVKAIKFFWVFSQLLPKQTTSLQPVKKALAGILWLIVVNFVSIMPTCYRKQA
jgi:hypothetical protein